MQKLDRFDKETTDILRRVNNTPVITHKSKRVKGVVVIFNYSIFSIALSNNKKQIFLPHQILFEKSFPANGNSLSFKNYEEPRWNLSKET